VCPPRLALHAPTNHVYFFLPKKEVSDLTPLEACASFFCVAVVDGAGFLLLLEEEDGAGPPLPPPLSPAPLRRYI
jgi:hypothetical protein